MEQLNEHWGVIAYNFKRIFKMIQKLLQRGVPIKINMPRIKDTISSEHYSIRTNDWRGFASGESVHCFSRGSWHTISFLLRKTPNWIQILPLIQKFYAKGGIQNHYDYKIHF